MRKYHISRLSIKYSVNLSSSVSNANEVRKKSLIAILTYTFMQDYEVTYFNTFTFFSFFFLLRPGLVVLARFCLCDFFPRTPAMLPST